MSDMTHLDELEAEAIYIMREVVAECEKPVMLYSIGKDSSVMLHLALKAFYPEKPPFPFLHVNTTWKFKEMIEFRDKIAEKYGLDMIEYINEEGVKKGINPFDHGSSYTDIMKTQALKQALDKYGFTGKYLATVWGKGTIVVDNKNNNSHYVKLVNDYFGGLPAPMNFTNGWFFAMYEPAVLMENIEKRMAASDCTDKDKELLKGLLESLDENDNNVMFIGKLKK